MLGTILLITFIGVILLTIGVFTAIGIFGLAFLLLMLLFDGIFDLFDGAPILPAAGFFISIFGFSGALAVKIIDRDEIGLLVIPVGVSILFTAIFFITYRSFKHLADKDEAWRADPQTLLGLTGRVNWWSGKAGEVIVNWLGQPQKLQATSEESLQATQTVYVTVVINENTVEVSSTNPALV